MLRALGNSAQLAVFIAATVPSLLVGARYGGGV